MVLLGWKRVEMKRGAGQKNLKAPEVEDSKGFGQFLVIIFPENAAVVVVVVVVVVVALGFVV